MHRIDTSTAQKDKFGAGKNGFTLGNAQTGVPPTEVSADILDALQEEVCAVIEDPDSGILLDKKNNGQLAAAIKALIYKKIKDIGLTKYGAPMIGVPIDWPLAQMPQDIWPDCGMVFLSCAGQSFNKTTYPIAAQLYPSGVMPEIRAEFVRAWDNGRGIDVGRALLSYQAAENVAHDHFDLFAKGGTPGGVVEPGTAFAKSYYGPNDSTIRKAPDSGWPGPSSGLFSSRSGGEGHPRSIAFHKIMRV